MVGCLGGVLRQQEWEGIAKSRSHYKRTLPQPQAHLLRDPLRDPMPGVLIYLTPRSLCLSAEGHS